MKLELDLNELLGFEYDESGEPVGKKNFRNEVVAMATHALVNEMREEATKTVREKIGEVVLDELRDMVRMIMEGPIQKRTPWGEPVGTPMTILEMIRTNLETFLSGTTSGSDRYGNRKPENLRQLIDESTREVLSTDLRQEVAEAKKQIHAEVVQKALKAAVESLTKGIKVP